MTKVFISYSHDSDAHRQSVLQLSDRLREDGLDCWIDQYQNGAPAVGWQRWMERQIESADFVLVICTAAYLKRFKGDSEDSGRGVNFEGVIISQVFYENFQKNTKFIPVIPDDGNWDNVPLIFKKGNIYKFEMEYEDLYRVLSDQPRATAKPLGKRKSFPLDAGDAVRKEINSDFQSGADDEEAQKYKKRNHKPKELHEEKFREYEIRIRKLECAYEEEIENLNFRLAEAGNHKKSTEFNNYSSSWVVVLILLLIPVILLAMNLFSQFLLDFGVLFDIHLGDHEVVHDFKAWNIFVFKTSILFLAFLIAFSGAIYMLRSIEVNYRLFVEKNRVNNAFTASYLGLLMVVISVLLAAYVITYEPTFMGVTNMEVKQAEPEFKIAD